MASYGVVVGGNRRVTAGHRSAISRPSRAVIGYLTPTNSEKVGMCDNCRGPELSTATKRARVHGAVEHDKALKQRTWRQDP